MKPLSKLDTQNLSYTKKRQCIPCVLWFKQREQVYA